MGGSALEESSDLRPVGSRELYRTGDVVEILEISRRQLQYWAQTDLVSPSVQTPGAAFTMCKPRWNSIRWRKGSSFGAGHRGRLPIEQREAVMQGDTGRRRNVQGVDCGGHRNPNDELGGPKRGLLETFALRPEDEGDPLAVLVAPTQLRQIDGAGTRR